MIDIEGIEYYPKQKRRDKRFKFWVFFVILLIVIAVYYLFNDAQQVVKKSNVELIIVKKPEPNKIKTQVIGAKLKTTNHSKMQAHEVLENLDEINQIYKNSNETYP